MPLSMLATDTFCNFLRTTNDHENTKKHICIFGESLFAYVGFVVSDNSDVDTKTKYILVIRIVYFISLPAPQIAECW